MAQKQECDTCGEPTTIVCSICGNAICKSCRTKCSECSCYFCDNCGNTEDKICEDCSE